MRLPDKIFTIVVLIVEVIGLIILAFLIACIVYYGRR